MNEKLSVYDHTPGAGPALVFLHYMGGTARTWRHVADALPGREIVQVDFRGWGRSAELPGPFGIEQYADDVIAVIGDAGLNDHVLVGHSMGGKVAQLVAARRPQGLRGIVLVASAPATPPAEVTPDYQEQISHAYDDAESIAAARDEVLTATQLSDELKQQVLDDSGSATPEVVHQWTRRDIGTDITERTRRIDVPALVIAGQHDRVEPPDTLRANLLPYLREARLVTIPRVGHLLPLEAPVELAELIRTFPTAADGSAS